MVTGAHDFFQTVLHSFLVVNMAGRNARKADDGIERRTNIMAHIGKEGGFCATGMLSLSQGILQKLLLLHLVEHFVIRIAHSEYGSEIILVEMQTQNALFSIAIIRAIWHRPAAHADHIGGLTLQNIPQIF